MEFEKEHGCVPGCCPEFGAIFMSNTATKEECFRRKLLGLPSGQRQFVMQVKTGMILFLFEFERRELHGVYQASSDGAMDIVPHAFSSSGKLFPAQVKFTPLWHCSPLSEVEFHDAIKENYYAARKFNFGLSEDQVRKLLYLFSLRKFKPQRHLMRHKVARYSRRAVDNERSIASNQVDGEHNADGSHGSVISTDYFGAALGSGGSTICNGRLEADARVGNEHEVDSDFGATLPTLYSGLLQPISKTTASTSSSDILQGDPFIQQIKMSSAFRCSMEPQACGDAVVPRPLLCDSDVPTVDFNPVRRFASTANNNAESPRYTIRYPDLSSGFDNPIPMPLHYYYGDFQSTGMPVLEAPYSDNTATNASENYKGFSLPTTSSGPVPLSDCGYVSYSFSPSHYPSFVLDCGRHEASQKRIDWEMPQGGISGAFPADVAMMKEGKSQLQGWMCEFNTIDHHDNSSLKPDVCQNNSGGRYSDGKKKESVFSRLTFPPKASVRRYDTLMGNDEDSMDTSVDDVISMLHHSHYKWLKTRKRQTLSSSNLLKDDSKKASDEVRTIDVPASKENDQFAEKTCFLDFKRRSELRKSHNSDTKAGGCSGSAKNEGCIGGLHKRRRLVRPDFSKNELTDDRIINVGTPQDVESSHVLGQISHGDGNVEGETVSNCKGEDAAETGEAPFRNVIEDVKDLSQNVDIGTLPSLSCEDSSYIAEESIRELSQDIGIGGLSQDLNNREVKELSQNIGIRTMPSSGSSDDKNCIAGEVLGDKDSVVFGLSQILNNSTHSFEQESSLEARETSGNWITSGETECSRNKEFFPNANFDGETQYHHQIL